MKLQKILLPFVKLKMAFQERFFCSEKVFFCLLGSEWDTETSARACRRTRLVSCNLWFIVDVAKHPVASNKKNQREKNMMRKRWWFYVAVFMEIETNKRCKLKPKL